MSYLGRKMREDLQLRGLSKKTESAYLREVRKLIKFYNKTPDLITEQELRKYFLYLIQERKISESLFTQAICGIKFFYTVTLNRTWKILDIVRPQKERKLPSILSKEEIKEIFNVTINLKHRCILTVIYSAGLRIGEACRLKISDIDPYRRLIQIIKGKGNKDRSTILGEQTLELLREYHRSYRPKHWLFPGQSSLNPINPRSVELVFNKACKKAGIKKNVTVHSLRHSFATHLMENGVNFRLIQSLLGHRSIRTTLIYTHVCEYHLTKVNSPIDTF